MSDTATPPSPFDQSSKQATAAGLSEGELRSAREDWIKLGHSAEDFDRALAADGVKLAATDAQRSGLHAQHGISETPRPDDYQVEFGEFGRSLPPERLVNLARATTEMASAMRLESSIGRAVIHRLVELRSISEMEPARRELWEQEQHAMLSRLAGGEDAAKRVMEDARAALQLAGNNEVAVALARSPTLNDAWLAMTLATHARSYRALTDRLTRVKS